MSDQTKEPVSENRLLNVRAWAAARVGQLSGAGVIVEAIDELLQMREDWAAISEAAEEFAADSVHEPRPDAEAIAAVPQLKDARALVLYFPTDADRDEFVSLIHEAKPGMRTVKL